MAVHLPRPGRSRRITVGIAAGLVALGLGAAIASVTIGTSSGKASPPLQATDPASPTATTATETLTGTPTPTPTATPTPEPPHGPQIGEKVNADPVRVYTGDGDCLNVRPGPGTQFQGDPYTCVPEGTLLWLWGNQVEADGYQWRYALGAGWVATRYTRTADAPKLRLPDKTVVTIWYRVPDKGGIEAARIDAATGTVINRVPLSDGGAPNPLVSPSGLFVSQGTWDGAVRIVRMDTGDYKVIRDAMAVQWHANDRLLLRVRTGDFAMPAWYDTVTGETHRLTNDGETDDGMVWSHDGNSVLLCIAQKLVRIHLDGRRQTISTFPEATTLWNAVPGPDGRSLMVGGGLMPVKVVDLETGAAREFKQAEQRRITGQGCGGGWSIVVAWMDRNRIIYHERFSANKEDGITIGDLATGKRTVFPFFNVQGLTTAGNNLVSFSTWINVGGVDTAALFLLDLATGDTWPLFFASGGTWPGGGQVVSEVQFGPRSSPAALTNNEPARDKRRGAVVI